MTIFPFNTSRLQTPFQIRRGNFSILLNLLIAKTLSIIKLHQDAHLICWNIRLILLAFSKGRCQICSAHIRLLAARAISDLYVYRYNTITTSHREPTLQLAWHGSWITAYFHIIYLVLSNSTYRTCQYSTNNYCY